MARVALGLLVCVMLVMVSSARTAEEPEVAVVGLGTVDVAAIWDAGVFQQARATLETKTSRFAAHSRHRCGIAPADLARVTMVSFKISAGENEFTPQALFLYTSRAPLDTAAVAKATGFKVVMASGKLDGLPDVAMLEDASKNHIAVGPKWVAVLPSVTENTARIATEIAMIRKAVARDADRAKDKTVASLSVDVAEFIRGLQNGLFDDGDPNNLPPVLVPLLKARVATLTATLGPSLAVKLDATFATAEDAKAAKPAVELTIKQLQRWLDDTEGLDQTPDGRAQIELQRFVASLLASGTATLKDRTISIAASHEITASVAKSAAEGIVALENAAARALSQNNLRQLVMAAHNDINQNEGGFLENICTDKGKPLLSWRVRLLPYMDQKALYDEFKLDEPWDSEHNKKLIAKMPKVFSIPSVVEAKEGTTFYQAFVGKKGAAVRPILQDGDEKGLNINSIADGTSNTIAMIEAADAVVWTKPDDLPFDNDGKLPKLGGHFEGGFNVALCDGSARFVKDTVPEVNLKAAITANGGEALTLTEE